LVAFRNIEDGLEPPSQILEPGSRPTVNPKFPPLRQQTHAKPMTGKVANLTEEKGLLMMLLAQAAGAGKAKGPPSGKVMDGL